jgi:hypothetical protein
MAAGCAGCEPCREAHCTCGNHLRSSEPLTCAKCVGKVRTNLQRIGDLCTLAPIAATEGGVTSAVMVLAGPVPEHSTHAARRTWVYAGGLCRCGARGQTCPDVEQLEGPACSETSCGHPTCARIHGLRVCPDVLSWMEYADDERHPLWVLGTWDMLVSEHLDHDRRARVTIVRAVAYLATNLTYLAQDKTFAFDELDREVKTCMEHVERVMGVAEHIQRGAPCPACRVAGRKPKALERRYDKDRSDDGNDRWQCPSKLCGQRYELDEYGKVIYLEYLENAKALTAAQMLAQYRVPEGTLRRWANGWTDARTGLWREPVVRKCGYDGQRRQLYDVADVKRMRDIEAA